MPPPQYGQYYRSTAGTIYHACDEVERLRYYDTSTKSWIPAAYIPYGETFTPINTIHLASTDFPSCVCGPVIEVLVGKYFIDSHGIKHHRCTDKIFRSYSLGGLNPPEKPWPPDHRPQKLIRQPRNNSCLCTKLIRVQPESVQIGDVLADGKTILAIAVTEKTKVRFWITWDFTHKADTWPYTVVDVIKDIVKSKSQQITIDFRELLSIVKEKLVPDIYTVVWGPEHKIVRLQYCDQYEHGFYVESICPLCHLVLPVDTDDVRDDTNIYLKPPQRLTRLSNTLNLGRILSRKCWIHGTDICTCHISAMDGILPFTVRPPEFAVGIEIEGLINKRLVSSFESLTYYLGHDSSVKADTDGTTNQWYGAEWRIPTFSSRAPIHAALASHWLRRLQVHVNKTCGLHVHVDARSFVNRRESDVLANNLANLWNIYEDWLYQTVFPQRKQHAPEKWYCAALKGQAICNENHHTVWNGITTHGTFECRLSPSTTNFFHAYAWVSFIVWMYSLALNQTLPKYFPEVPSVPPMEFLVLAYVRRTLPTGGVAHFANFCADVLRSAKYASKIRSLNDLIPHAVQLISEYVTHTEDVMKGVPGV